MLSLMCILKHLDTFRLPVWCFPYVAILFLFFFSVENESLQ